MLVDGSEWTGRPLAFRAAGRHIGFHAAKGGRKVRAPQDVVMGNAHRP
jgi:hypothetical protein